MKHKEILRVVLDQPQLYIEETLNTVMVRGEVIVNFSKDTQIQGPIELVFEGIQKYQTWPEIMKDEPLRPPIETILQVIELSLLPPNTKGIMPAGVQRFPFEFPVPTQTPTTVHIPDRLDIFYQLTATLRRSTDSSSGLIDWARRNAFKKTYVSRAPIRIIRAMESIVSDGLPTTHPHGSAPSLTLIPIATNDDADLSPRTSQESVATAGALSRLPWYRRSLSEYQQSTLDEQHDQLAFSLAGRTCGNFNQLPHMLQQETQGIRYKLAVDRTAIAIGTSIGIELMIEPTFADAVVKSVVLKISESRKYAMRLPAVNAYSSSSSSSVSETKRYHEGVRMVIKWAFGYQEVENDDGGLMEEKKKYKMTKKPGDKYVHQRSCSSHFLAYFDPPPLGHPNYKSFLGQHPDSKPVVYDDDEQNVTETEHSSSSAAGQHDSVRSSSDVGHLDIMNLKELNQEVKLGEYFGGRFVMPVPDCDGILNPSMEHESISISHWLQLIVTVECNGQKFDLTLDSPSRMLDCRVVAVDDQDQTILPPPPSYEPGDVPPTHDWSTGTFWEQREPITFASGWGATVPCPCQAKKLHQNKSKKYTFDTNGSEKRNKKKNAAATSVTPPNLLPEWGPPPAYEI